MMSCGEVEAVALALPEAVKIVLFRDKLDVYKVRKKVFCVCGAARGLTFKATEIAYAVLTEDGPGRPAPGFAPGKGHWVNLPLSEAEREDVEGWLVTSYRLAAGTLTKKARAELGVL